MGYLCGQRFTGMNVHRREGVNCVSRSTAKAVPSSPRLLPRVGNIIFYHLTYLTTTTMVLLYSLLAVSSSIPEPRYSSRGERKYLFFLFSATSMQKTYGSPSLALSSHPPVFSLFKSHFRRSQRQWRLTKEAERAVGSKKKKNEKSISI